VGLLVAGCTSTPTRVDKGPIKAATFDFVTRITGPRAVIAESDEAIHAMIQDAITANLAAKGVARVAGGGDVKVAYLLVVGNNVSSMAVDDYFGYGRDSTELAEKAHKAAAVDNKNPDYFEAGALLIDVVDATTFELLKRSYVVRPVIRDASADERQARIRDAVDEALIDLRIKP
jgi:hypothetical protein